MNNGSLKKMLGLAGLCAVLLFAAYYSMFSDIKRRNEHASALGDELAVETRNEQYMLSVERELTSSGADIARVNGSIIPADADVTFIDNFESLARSGGLSIEIKSLALKTDNQLLASSTKALDIVAQTKGSWSGTYSFLVQMESLPYKIKINKFSVLKLDNGIWQSDFDITALKYK